MLAAILAAATAVATAVGSPGATPAGVRITVPPEVQKMLNQTVNPSRSPLAQHVPWLTHAFAGIFIVSAFLLIVLLAVQTTKQEGLSGTIGGRVESTYGRRLGGDTQIARITTFIAIIFVLFGTLLSLSGI